MSGAVLCHRGTEVIVTKRLNLRRYELTDAEQMFKNYATDARVTRFLSWEPYENVEDVRTFLAMTIAEYTDEDKYRWAIELDGEMIGSITAMTTDEKNLSCEIGYCLGYDFWGKGIMSEAVLAVMDFLFNRVGMERIMAKHDEENPASGRVMKKCGMVYEGCLRSHYRRHDGTRSDSLVYGILKKEFNGEPRR